MKNKSITIIILLMGFFINTHGQDSLALKTTEGLGEQALMAFKTNNFELFKSLLITESKHELILDKIQATDSLKSVYRKQGIGSIKRLHYEAKQNFEDILSLAKSNNINWGNTELMEVKSFSRSRDGFERADIIIYAKSGETKFAITLANCHKSDIWHIMNKVKMRII